MGFLNVRTLHIVQNSNCLSAKEMVLAALLFFGTKCLMRAGWASLTGYGYNGREPLGGEA